MHYKLEKYRNRSSRYPCPACGDKHSFTRYICIETGRHVHESVGRCDHESSCGYHYTPSQFFRDNPWDAEQIKVPIARRRPLPPPPDPVYLDPRLVGNRMSPDSSFFSWLQSKVGQQEATDALHRFRLGATLPGKFKTPAVIFWQIDKFGNVHDGKMMWYRTDGHREKYMTWVSSRLKAAGLYPDQDTVKCLFGEHQLIAEHLLPDIASSKVVLVESEKSAIVGSCLWPRYIWMATCGCGGLNRDKLRPLHGHHVLVIPDAGEYGKWDEILSTSGIDYTMTDVIEAYPPNTDIVDIIFDGVKPIYGPAANLYSLLTI